MEYDALAKQYDSIDMMKLIDAEPADFQKAFDLGYAVDLPPSFASAEHVIGMGMGGSGMAYSILKDFARVFGTVSVEVVSDYWLPSYVKSGQKTAVMITSFSGNTEEPLSSVEEARQAGLPIVSIATGGQLATWSKEHNVPYIPFEYPVSLPRVGIAYTLGIALGVFCKAGFFKFDDSAPNVVKAALDGIAQHVHFNEMKTEGQRLAELLKGKMIYCIGAGWSYPVAIRWKGQFNENAKVIAFAEPMPEMCHNMYLGYELPEIIRTNSAVVFLDSEYDHERNRKRNQLVGHDLEATGVTIIYPTVSDELSPLGTLLAQIILGDYVSYYLALLNKKDPAEMTRIEDLKQRL